MIDAMMTLLTIILKIVCVLLPVILAVAYATYAERKIIGYIQCRIGPNRVGPKGWLQPIADVIKMLFKEVVRPTQSNRYLFMIAPVLTLVPALVAWSVIPFQPGLVLANVNAGVLFILAATSLGIYGVLIAGWASNSKYAIYGALRGAAQAISYEIAMGFALVGVLLAAHSMNLSAIVVAQSGGLWHWYFLPLFPLFLVYWISGLAETNRAPFDMVEGESEIVAGFHVEYGGIAFGLFFLAEYANMILISFLLALFFFGGWLSPFQGIPVLGPALQFIPGVFWLILKAAFFLFAYLWIRATFPRFRYDHIMRLGWKVLIPIALGWIVLVAAAIQCHLPPWFM